MADYEVLTLANFRLQRGLTLPEARLAYKTYGSLNAAKSNAILYPTSYGAQHADIDWLIPHQANIRIIEATAKKMGLPMDKVIVTVDQHGNTSAASVPLALDSAVRDGRIRRGQKVMLEGVGGGFTWGAVLLEF